MTVVPDQNEQERRVVWLRTRGGLNEGRLEREIVGLTPFDDVPKSPYYSPAPGWWASGRAWMDEDGVHVWHAHDCTDGREVSIMPWPTWQWVADHIDPSVDCPKCGYHGRTGIAFEITTVGVS